MLTRTLYILLSIMLASAFACVLPDEELDGPAEESSFTEDELQDLDEEAILKDLDSESLSATSSIRLRSSHHLNYGGTFLAEDHLATFGGMCSPGWRRVSPPNVTYLGNGHCEFREWLDPYNTNDCRARVLMHYPGGWLRGDCYIDIFEQYAAPSCEGYCGKQTPNGCWCDTACRSFGDCCMDYDPVCVPPELQRTNLSGSGRTWKGYSLNVPSGQSSVSFSITGGSGDADLYVRYGSAPTSSVYACRPRRSGNVETCTIPKPTAGTWYVSLYGYSSYSGVTLTGDYDK